MNISSKDKNFFEEAINLAKKAYELGNYPVGAILVFDDEIVGIGENKIKETKSFLAHAEMRMIIENAPKMLKAHDEGKTIKLYSTLEPCLQCFGASVMNKVDEIYYIQKDPHGGACDIKYDGIGVHYPNIWPKIYHCPYTDEPLDLMISFFKDEIKRGNTNWPTKMLELYNESK